MIKRLLMRLMNIITALMGVLMVITGAMLDSENQYPVLICTVCLLWVGLYVTVRRLSYVER